MIYVALEVGIGAQWHPGYGYAGRLGRGRTCSTSRSVPLCCAGAWLHCEYATSIHDLVRNLCTVRPVRCRARASGPLLTYFCILTQRAAGGVQP